MSAPEPLTWTPIQGSGPFETLIVTDKRALTCKVVGDNAVESAAAAFEYEFDGICQTEVPRIPVSSLPFDFKIGILIGPSGTGKSTHLRELSEISLLASFPADVSVKTAIGSLVGFNIGLELLDAMALPQSCRSSLRCTLSIGEDDRADAAVAQKAIGRAQARLSIDEWTSRLDRALDKTVCANLSYWMRSAGH